MLFSIFDYIVLVGARFSTSVQTGPGVHTTSYTIGTGSFLGVKRPGRGVDHTPPSAEVKERVELYLYSPFWAFVASSWANVTFIISGERTCWMPHVLFVSAQA